MGKFVHAGFSSRCISAIYFPLRSIDLHKASSLLLVHLCSLPAIAISSSRFHFRPHLADHRLSIRPALIWLHWPCCRSSVLQQSISLAVHSANSNQMLTFSSAIISLFCCRQSLVPLHLWFSATYTQAANKKKKICSIELGQSAVQACTFRRPTAPSNLQTKRQQENKQRVKKKFRTPSCMC